MDRLLKLALNRLNGLRSARLLFSMLPGSLALLMCFANTTPAFARGGELSAHERVMQHAGPDLRLEGRGAAGADAEQPDRPVPYISAPGTNPSTPTVSAPRTVDGGATPLTLLGTSSDTRVRPTVSSQTAQANFALPSAYVNAAETRSIEVRQIA